MTAATCALTTVHLPALEHTAVRLVPLEVAQPPAARPADLPAGARRTSHLVGRAPPTPRGLARRRPPLPPSSAMSSRPGLLDRYLGRTGVKSQQTDEPIGPRPDDLFSAGRR